MSLCGKRRPDRLRGLLRLGGITYEAKRHMSRTGLIVGCLAAIALTTASWAGGYTFTEEPVEGEVDVRAEIHVDGGWGAEKQARVVLSYAEDDNHLYVAMGAGGLTLGEVCEGEDTVLDACDQWPSPAKQGVYRVTIKRRSWSIRVLCEGHLVLRAYDEFAPGDKIGWQAEGAIVQDLYAQPIGEIVFDDDFARPPDEPNPWETLTGQWLTKLPDSRNKQSDPTKTANPFSYGCKGPDALAAAGSEQWDGYEAKTAVKPISDGYVGLAFYLQDKDNYYVFRVMAAPTASAEARAQLVSVVGGKESVLAQAPACLLTGKWYSLGVVSHDGNLQGLLDGTVLCKAEDNTLSEGRIGLYAKTCATATFDDVSLRDYREFNDDFGPDGIIPIDQVAGTWDIAGGKLIGKPDPQTYTGIGLTGCSQWSDYRVEAQVIPNRSLGVGLYFGCVDAANYYLFRWGADRQTPSQDIQELWRVSDAKGALLASSPAKLNRGAPQSIAVTMDRGYIAVEVGGKRVLDSIDITRESDGAVGYHVEGGAGSAAQFDNLRVTFCHAPAEPVSITEQFSKEDTMADWARPIASWPGMGNRVYRWDLPVWGDFDLRIQLAAHSVRAARTIGLVLADTPEGIKGATPVAELKTEKDSGKVECAVPEGTGQSGSGEFGEQDPLLELQRRGACLLVRLDGQPIAWANVPDGKQAPHVGLKLGGLGVSMNDVNLVSPQIVDASFTGAPTDWLPKDGDWDISDRWNCQPQWSWFCGRNAETPLLWSKQSFSGDMVFEYWAGVMMDMPKGPGYSHPSDLNGVLCGDGENLCSGYAVVLAGDNNTRGKILRKGETVAESAHVVFDNPTTGNLNGFHRHWFHVRTEKMGGRITMYVDGQKVLEYDDPAPLAAGKIGLWSAQGNGMMVARVRVAYAG